MMVAISRATALTMGFAPPAAEINVGESIDIDVVLTGLDDTKIGAFDFNVGFDPAIISFDSYLLGEGLGDIGNGDALDLSLGNLGGRMINLAELSILLTLPEQSEPLTLATLTFTGKASGISSLTFLDVALGDEMGDPLPLSLQSGRLSVDAPVPEPTTLLLLASGIVGILGIRKRFS